MTDVCHYFDNGATSFPKPPEVAEEVSRYLNDIGGPYGRSFYRRAFEVSGVVEEVRELLAAKIGTDRTEKILFTPNATHGINLVLKGLPLDCKEVWISPLEHNAVVRPLRRLKKDKNIKVRFLPSFSDGKIDVERLNGLFSEKTGLVVVNHQSNVNGVIQPIEDIKKAAGDIPILVDAAQSLGHLKIKADDWKLDFVAFTGHKGLLGPTGTGGVYVADSQLNPLVEGGTGSRSESSRTPEFLPDKFEAGTPNIAGIFGLRGALLNSPSPRHTREDFLSFVEAIKSIGGYKVLTANDSSDQGELISVISNTLDSSALGMELYDKFEIETRLGLHCAPLAHKFLGSFPNGTVRIAPSIYHQVSDFEFLLGALTQISKKN